MPIQQQFGTLALMAMQFFRNKKNSTFTVILFGLIIISFIFWGVFQEEGGGISVLTTVNGDPVPYSEFQRVAARQLEAYGQIFGGGQAVNKNLEQFVRRQVAQSLISRKILAQEADQIGIVVGQADVLAELNKIEAFQDPDLKRFSPRIYQIVLEQNGIQPRNFESSLIEEIKARRYRQLVDASSLHSNSEIESKFLIENTTADLWSARFSLKSPSIASAIRASEEDLKKFYDQNQSSFLTPEKRVFQIARISLEDVEIPTASSDEEVEVYYDQKIAASSDPKWADKKARAFHILVSDRSQEGLKKAQKIARDLKSEKAKSSENFEKVFKKAAREFSEDYATAFKGGDLGYFASSDMVKPFSDPVFKAKAGDLLGPIKTDFGYHLVFVVDQSTSEKSLDNRRNEILYELSKEKRKQATESLRGQVRRDYVNKANENLQKLTGLGFEITETPALQSTDRTALLPFSLTQQAFQAELKSWIEPEEFEDSLLLVRSLEVLPPEPMSFEEARSQIQSEIQGEKLQSYVMGIYEDLKANKLKISNLKAKGADLREQKNQKLNEMTSIEGFSSSDPLLRELHSLSAAHPLSTPLLVEGDWVILEATNFKNPSGSTEDLAKVKTELKTAKQTDVLDSSLQKLMKNAKIPQSFRDEFGI